ncbi:hypothetical protein K449DRAFT_260468 [Hypoxylon sp. EC38]|nr:hypothetical protein K449DRAFT_260468 [Hypoxylon sp. EC38]
MHALRSFPSLPVVQALSSSTRTPRLHRGAATKFVLPTTETDTCARTMLVLFSLHLEHLFKTSMPIPFSKT